MIKRFLSLICVIALLLSLTEINVRATEEMTMVDGSYLTNDDESEGETSSTTRGVDLLTGTCKVSKASSTAIVAGGTTTAKHVVDDIGVSVAVERLRVGGSTWSYYKGFQATKEDAAYVSASKRYTVATGYYYRVRAVHWANDDVSGSFTNGILMD